MGGAFRDTHHASERRNGFRERLNPSYELDPSRSRRAFLSVCAR
jgi:hypothetical protein